MKFTITIKRVVTETIAYEVSADTTTHALDFGILVCEHHNDLVKNQISNITTSYHVAKVENKKE